MAKNRDQQRPERPKVRQEANPDPQEDKNEKKKESDKNSESPDSSSGGDNTFHNDNWEFEMNENFDSTVDTGTSESSEPEENVDNDFSSFDFEKNSESEATGFEREPPPSKPFSTEHYQGTQPGSAEIIWDRETSYFFMFGVKDAGKTVILSGLFYNIFAHRIGDGYYDLNDPSIEHQRRGSRLLQQMLEEVPNGKWPDSTSTLISEGKLIPRQINLHFKARHSKNEFKFSVMDMAGEDLMRIRPDSENGKPGFEPGIEGFLRLPHENLAFICVYPAKSKDSSTRLSSYVQLFLDELRRIEHIDTPILFIVSQWDLVEKDYESPEEFLEKNARIIWAKLNEPDRQVTIMTFSIGKADKEKGTYSYKPQSSNKLLKWMYKTQMGEELDQEVSPGLWEKIMKMINRY